MNPAELAPQPAFEHHPYSVKRHGLTLANCDSEPVQTPGCVQAHGALLVLRLADLSILQASENTEALLRQSSKNLLGRSIDAVIGVEGQDQLRELLARESSDRNPLYLLTLPASGSAERALDVTVHTVDGVVILEFESTGHSDAAHPDYYALVKKAVARLQTAGSLQQFCDSVVAEIRELTGLDRVMVYKFHADGHGEVVAESRCAGLSSWLGQHYPAEDIPQPARDVFTRTWIRPVPDVSDGLAEMIPLLNPDTGKPLNMTYCALRGVSLMCTEFSRNMGLTATLTMPIRRNESLWGLISCHHYAGPRHLPYQVRAACEFLAQVVSLQHHAAEDKEHLAYRIQFDSVHQQLVAAAAQEGDLTSLTNGSPSVLEGIDAGGAALYYRDRWWCIGNTPTEAELQGLGDWLLSDAHAFDARSLYATDSLVLDYPPAAAFAEVASGLLALPLSRKGRQLLLWFRPEIIRTVHWGGNPHDKTTVRGPNGPRLTPRHSFELFAESVHQRALPWKEVELEAASRLRLSILELVIGRAELLADLNADLARSNEELDAFAYVAGHDLKEPLRGIHRYAHQLLEEAALADPENRGKLDRMMRLTLRMDSLIDSLSHFSRVGRTDFNRELVDLNDLVAEEVEMVGSRGRAVSPEIVVPRPFASVWCNRVGCREVFVNLLSNALKYTDKARPRIEVGYIRPDEDHPRPGCPEGSAGQCIYYVADNGIGIQAANFEHIFRMFKRLHARDEYGGGPGAGLTLVRKLVERHGGEVWLESLPGLGSTFYFTLPAD